MSNLYLRILSSIILLPFFLSILYFANIYLKLLVLTILLIGIYETLKNINQFFFKIFIILSLLFFSFALIKIRGIAIDDFIISVWLLSIVWLSDIGGYVFGKLFGKKKLCTYSPNKTVEGFFGALLLSQFSVFILIYFSTSFELNFLIFLIQLLISIVSIIGDIFFSFIKRINNIKDYSNLIPGHGGILDRIDGLIFSVIFYYLISKIYDF